MTESNFLHTIWALGLASFALLLSDRLDLFFVVLIWYLILKTTIERYLLSRRARKGIFRSLMEDGK